MSFEIEVRFRVPMVDVAVVRASSVTQSVNVDQRWVGLERVSAFGTRMTVRAPPSGAVAPPGWYLRTVIDEEGRAARAQGVRLG